MAIQRQWPEMMIQVNTALHRLFIQAPPQDVFQYCIDIIKLIGLIPTPAFKLPVMKKKSKSSHKKLNYKRVSTHSFTQAVSAKNVDDATHAYWSIPKMYLDLNFKPGTLEMFLVNEWKEQLLPLLGVAQYEVPWIRNSLTGNIDHIRIHNSNNKITKLEDLKQIAMLLSVKRNERRRAIQNVDEKLNRIDIDGVVNPHCCCNSKNDTQTENKICVDHEFALKGSRSKLLNIQYLQTFNGKTSIIMRIVHLNRSNDFNPFDVIIKNGCGPHFVLNRLELFESMIREQGVPFWFRFWLDFCYSPGCEDLAIINNEWPEMRDYVNTGVHTLFVKGSLEEAFQYSVNVVKLMRVNLPDLRTLLSATAQNVVSKTKVGTTKKKKKKETFFDVLQSTFIKCTGMAFGANLCVIFYEWLAAKDADETAEYYWGAPKKYFEHNFQPGELEIYLADEWKDKLVWLLGVSYYQVPWLRKLLIGKLDSVTQIKHQTINKVYCLQDVKQVAKLLSIKRNEKRMTLQRVDEMPNVYENKISKSKKLRKRRSNSKCRLNEEKCHREKSDLYSTYTQRPEMFLLLQSDKTKTQTSNICIDEKWIERRCYCNNYCRIQHWYQDHQKEHYDIGKNCSVESFTKKREQTSYDMILNLGCGPNFLLNRIELFETMIKEQGVTFWFRFWLSFCFNPGCNDLIAVRRQWPEMSGYVNRGVHKLFLLCSHQDTCQYCLDIIKLLSISSPTNKPSHVLVKKAIHKKKQTKVAVKMVLQELLIKCFQMAYSCSLCVVFYEWLGAKRFDESSCNSSAYWTVPAHYLDPKFQPGPFEIFLAIEWKDKLASLLGVTYKQAPWLKKLVKERSEILYDTKGNLELDSKLFSLDTVTKVAVLLSIRRNEHRKAIKQRDEIPNGSHLKSSEKVRLPRKKSRLKPKHKEKQKKDALIPCDLKTRGRTCAFCDSEIKNTKKYAKCNRCSNENWLDQRYYCSNTCKVEHWFQEHYKEHREVMNQKKKINYTTTTLSSYVTTLCQSRTY
uniref:MYND-type domain-containing protein n=1 Tax=Strigamia maritima TaxID=126957 RepID=T1IJB6_STRMM